MKLPNKGRGITLATLVLALGAAVYMNWAFAKQTPPTAQADQGQEAVETSASDGAVPVLEPFSAETAAPESGKNYGEAQLVSANQDSGTEFFEQARLERTKSRDEALDSIKKALKNTGLSAEEKEKLTEKLEVQVGTSLPKRSWNARSKPKGLPTVWSPWARGGRTSRS